TYRGTVLTIGVVSIGGIKRAYGYDAWLSCNFRNQAIVTVRPAPTKFPVPGRGNDDYTGTDSIRDCVRNNCFLPTTTVSQAYIDDLNTICNCRVECLRRIGRYDLMEGVINVVRIKANGWSHTDNSGTVRRCCNDASDSGPVTESACGERTIGR